MLMKYHRVFRWLMLIGGGSFLFSTGGCDLTLQGIQTGLLGIITGSLFILARNV